MRVIESGHIYELNNVVVPSVTQRLSFRRTDSGMLSDGLSNQEVLRVLIDRVEYMQRSLPHKNNPEIIAHLRAALILHESRALERKVEKGEIAPERLPVGEDGHFRLYT